MGKGLAISLKSPPESHLSFLLGATQACPPHVPVKCVQTMLGMGWEWGIQTLLLGLSDLSPSGLLIPMCTDCSQGWDSGSV